MFLCAMLPDLSKWFNTRDINYKREDLAMLIQKISNEENGKIKAFQTNFPKQGGCFAKWRAGPTIPRINTFLYSTLNFKL